MSTTSGNGGDPIRRCQARRKTGEPCRGPAVRGRNVCRMHGGSSLSGVASPAWRHGRYSRYLPGGLRRRYERAAADQELLALRDEIALVDARSQELLGRIAAAEGDAAEALWPSVWPLVDRRRQLAEAESRRQTQLQLVLTLEQARHLVLAITESVKRHVQDEGTLRRISADLARLAAPEAEH